jgi:hypothetical protein
LPADRLGAAAGMGASTGASRVFPSLEVDGLICGTHVVRTPVQPIHLQGDNAEQGARIPILEVLEHAGAAVTWAGYRVIQAIKKIGGNCHRGAKLPATM